LKFDSQQFVLALDNLHDEKASPLAREILHDMFAASGFLNCAEGEAFSKDVEIFRSYPPTSIEGTNAKIRLLQIVTKRLHSPDQSSEL
jgi:hypothetical protein